jgi:hypothetical protein
VAVEFALQSPAGLSYRVGDVSVYNVRSRQPTHLFLRRGPWCGTGRASKDRDRCVPPSVSFGMRELSAHDQP